MEPINSNERARVYYKVVGLFVACFILAMSLGFSTMNVNKLTDIATRKKLSELEKANEFQEKTFHPNIDNATKKLIEIQKDKEKVLNLSQTKSDINNSLQTIQAGLKPEDQSWQHLMYKNIIDIYYALESAFDSNYKLQADLESKDNVVQPIYGDLQRSKDMRDALKGENESLKTQIANINKGFTDFKEKSDDLQKQLGKCQEDLTAEKLINKGLNEELKKYKSIPH